MDLFLYGLSYYYLHIIKNGVMCALVILRDDHREFAFFNLLSNTNSLLLLQYLALPLPFT